MKTILLILALMTGTLSAEDGSLKITNHKEHADTKWTCSMHPQIVLPKKGKCPICFMDLIPLVEHTSEAVSIPEASWSQHGIVTAVVKRLENATHELNLYGETTRNPDEDYQISAWTEGRIESVFSRTPGDIVEKGNPVYSIYSPELISVQQEYLTLTSTNRSPESINQHKKLIQNKLYELGAPSSLIKTLDQDKKITRSIPFLSPVSGVLLKMNISSGQWVKKGQTIADINNWNSIRAEFRVYPEELALLQKDPIENFNVFIESEPQNHYEAKWKSLLPFTENKDSHWVLSADIQTSNQYLPAGAYVNASIDMSMSPGLFVPKESILFTGMRKGVVYHYVKDTGFLPVKVTVTGESSNLAKIEGKLKENDVIAAKGAFVIDSQAQIHGFSSMITLTPEEKKEPAMKMKAPELTEKEKAQLSEIFSQYLAYESALAEDWFSEAANRQSDMLNLIDTLVTRPELHHYFKHYEISKETDPDSLRKNLNQFSRMLIPYWENDSISNTEGTAKAFCPMAFDNKGAEWLQQGNDIFNPYFGEAMLKCGSIRSEK
jgi:Cu(I)/Ag(I) efflux system membrane fusion protein